MEIKQFSPLVAQMFMKEIGKYASHSGVNKLFHLMSAIDLGRTHIGEEEIIEFIENDLKRLKDYEEKTGNKITIFKHIKDWNHIFDKFDALRPRLAKIQQKYDEIAKKKMEDKSELNKIKDYRKHIKKVSPYQPEMYYILNVILQMSNIQMRPIPAEYLKSIEMSEYQKNTFTKMPVKTEPTQSTENTSA